MAKKNAAKATKTTPVEAIKHKDARVNIPTQELRHFVAEDEAKPKTLLYPRDPSLDPQLAWKGKDEQDATDLAVPVVPVYIQEKVHPQALVESLRDTAKTGEPEPELQLFADFNGIPEFDRKVEFYRHEGHWSNRMILGDSLLVMASLAEKEGLKGKVQRIYLDPPYGIKFGSNWQVSTRKRDVRDGKVEDATRQPEQVRAFRDTWQLGIHSYLTYLRDRLVGARDLLTDTGSVFVQIGDEARRGSGLSRLPAERRAGGWPSLGAWAGFGVGPIRDRWSRCDSDAKRQPIRARNRVSSRLDGASSPSGDVGDRLRRERGAGNGRRRPAPRLAVVSRVGSPLSGVLGCHHAAEVSRGR